MNKERLFKGLEKDEADELRGMYSSSSRLRKRTVEVIKEEVESLQRDMEREKWLETPNWSLVQADRLAQVKALRKIISLFEK